MSRVPIPSTTPEPSDDPEDPLNVIALVFEALAAGFAAELLRSSTLPEGCPYSEETNALVIKILPYLSHCMSYFATHIIIPSRESEFRHDFTQLSATLLAGVADSAELHFRLYQEITSLPATHELRSATGNSSFLSCILPLLLFHDTSSSPTSREETVFQCFRLLGCFISTEYYMLPPEVKQLYNAVQEHPEALVDVFQPSVILNIGRLRAFNSQMSRGEYYRICDHLAAAYRAILFFFSIREVLVRLMHNNHIRWTCEMLCIISDSKYLRRFVITAPAHFLSGKSSGPAILTMCSACVSTGYRHIDHLIASFGPAVARQAFKDGAVLSIVRMLHLISQACPRVIPASMRDSTVGETMSFLERAGVYFVYCSVLKYAIRLEPQMKTILPSEILATASWKTYNKHFNDMVVLYKLYQQNPVTICDGPECPNLDSAEPHPLRVCAGCVTYYYCSEACQKRAWAAGHRKVCPDHQEALESNINQYVASRDALFFCYIRQAMMSKFVDSDKSLVRHLDFSKFPPLLELRTLDSYHRPGAPEHEQLPELPDRHGVPIVTIMPMGDNDLKRVEKYDEENSGTFGEVIRYHPSIAYSRDG